MTGGALSTHLQQLAELLVLAEPDDAPSLQAVVDALGVVAEAADRDGLGDVRTMAVEAAEVVARVIENPGKKAAGRMASLSDMVAEMSRLLGDAQGQAHLALEDDELIREFVIKADEHLDAVEQQLLAMEDGNGGAEPIDAVFRAFHTIKGMTGFLSLDDIHTLAHEGESLLEGARKKGGALDRATVDEAFGVVDGIREAVSALRERGVAEDQDSEGTGGEALGEARNRVREMIVRETVRVDAARLDQLLDAVGELVIAESMASRTARLEMGDAHGLAKQLGRLDKLTRQLHEMAGSLRMVPLRPTLQHLARAVRDLSRKSGKEIDFAVSGAETELDKAIVDRIADPLLHLVRNAVDHGIEDDRKTREAAGKPPVGRVELRAYHKAGSIYVEVEDDGRGMDRGAILAKARALGLVEEDAIPSERELLDLILRPGFSTSTIVTDVSGRGVGMDVVKRTVESLAGQLTVRSAEGRGCTFVMRLPITLAIIDGMAIRVGSERYIVPTLSVVRSVRPEAADLSTVFDRAEALRLGDELLRLIRLREVFGVGSDDRALTDSIVMVVEDDKQRAGLVIDELLGQQQIVIKSLKEALGDVVGVSGGAVMPDGRVGLILDVEGLVTLANEA